MTRFLDGPAQGQHFMIRRTPIFVRVTEENGKWDILNDAGDAPRKTETPRAYVLTERPGMVCIRAAKGRGGIFQSGVYRHCDPQPNEATMRDESAWTAWVWRNRGQAPQELLPNSANPDSDQG